MEAARNSVDNIPKDCRQRNFEWDIHPAVIGASHAAMALHSLMLATRDMGNYLTGRHNLEFMTAGKFVGRHSLGRQQHNLDSVRFRKDG